MMMIMMMIIAELKSVGRQSIRVDCGPAGGMMEHVHNVMAERDDGNYGNLYQWRSQDLEVAGTMGLG